MAERKDVEALKILNKLLKEKRIKIYKMLVFGSYAKGEERDESDIDIIVVSEDFENKDIFERVEMTSGLHRKLVERIMIPVDIMYYSITEWGKGDSLIINAAKKSAVYA